MDNTWKSLLDDGLNAGLMNNWLFTYQHFSAFFLLGLWNQRVEENCFQSAISQEDVPERVDFPVEDIPMLTTDVKFLSRASESIDNAT